MVLRSTEAAILPGSTAGDFSIQHTDGANVSCMKEVSVSPPLSHGPAIKPGTQSDHICAFQDVMPTLAELAGITCPPTDGISFLPTLLGKKGKQKEHTYLYWEYPDPRIGNKAIRMGKWKGIITDIRKGNTQMQLYNLETDIREEHDVAAQHPDIVKRFERLMKEARNGPDF